jgi:hypothetical protein
VVSLIPSQLAFGFVLSSFFHGRANANSKSLEVPEPMSEPTPDKSIDTMEIKYSRRAFLGLLASAAIA